MSSEVQQCYDELVRSYVWPRLREATRRTSGSPSTPETDAASLADAVGEALERYGLPWLRERSSDEELRDTLLADPESAYDHELAFLAELIEQIGPRSALAAVKREQKQRAGERP